MPYDLICSGVFALISILSGQLSMTLLGLPLFLYNLNLYFVRKTAKLHFVTMRDFQPLRQQVRRQLYGKTAYYVVLFIAAVVMFIISVVRVIHIII